MKKFLLTVFSVAAVAGTIGLAAHIMWPLYVVGLLASVIGIYVATSLNKQYEGDKAQWLVVLSFAVGLLCMFGPAVAKKAKRSSSIPDVAVLHSNGKVINATDSSRNDFYFKHFDVSSEDSAYIVKFGEEPGRNHHAYVKTSGDSSKAPRADENWVKPPSKWGKKLNGKY